MNVVVDTNTQNILILPPICLQVVVIARISSAVYWTVSIASVSDATPPPTIILITEMCNKEEAWQEHIETYNPLRP